MIIGFIGNHPPADYNEVLNFVGGTWQDAHWLIATGCCFEDPVRDYAGTKGISLTVVNPEIPKFGAKGLHPHLVLINQSDAVVALHNGEDEPTNRLLRYARWRNIETVILPPHFAGAVHELPPTKEP